VCDRTLCNLPKHKNSWLGRDIDVLETLMFFSATRVVRAE
jgi:hypothetical protein